MAVASVKNIPLTGGLVLTVQTQVSFQGFVLKSSFNMKAQFASLEQTNPSGISYLKRLFWFFFFSPNKQITRQCQHKSQLKNITCMKLTECL